jgi:hypothetical protein
MMVRVSWDDRRMQRAAFQFVRHDRQNRTVLRATPEEGEAFRDIAQRSGALGARLSAEGEEVSIDLRT